MNEMNKKSEIVRKTGLTIPRRAVILIRKFEGKEAAGMYNAKNRINMVILFACKGVSMHFCGLPE